MRNTKAPEGTRTGAGVGGTLGLLTGIGALAIPGVGPLIAIAFEDPLATLAAAKEAPPALLFTDVIMPAKTGVELAIQIRNRRPDCKTFLPIH